MPELFNLPTEETLQRIADAQEKLASRRVPIDFTGAPGSTYLLAGDTDAGFLGFVQSADFITGDALTSDLAITEGTSQNSDGAWIKYIWQGKICFTSLKTVRHSISWDAIHAAGAVYAAQDTQVVISGLTYIVRLFRGAADDPTDSYADNDRGSIGIENEWNAIILPLHERAKTQDWEYPEYAGDTEYWEVDLTDEDLRTHYDFGNGSRSWCQETNDVDGSERLYRGNHGASRLSASPSGYTGSLRGWRPVLELLG